LPAGTDVPADCIEPMPEKQIIKSIKALARGECANYQKGMCLETDQRCHLINQRYDSIRDGMIDCDYFLECVLPADWDLNDLVSYALWYDEAEDDDLPPDMRRCQDCQQPFVFTNNRQQFCSACAKKRDRQNGYQRLRKFREKERE